MEEWRDIPGWEGMYQISDLGRVRSLNRFVTEVGGNRRRQPSRILSFSTVPPYGYLKCDLKDKATSRRETRYAHELVLTAFVGQRPDGMQGAHGDGVCTNNILTNLRWATPGENTRQKLEHGTQPRGEQVVTAAFTNLEADAIRTLHQRGAAIYGLAKVTGVTRSTIQKIVQGKHYAA